MAEIRQTLFRFAGALLLGAAATTADRASIRFAPATEPVAVARRDAAMTPGKRAYAIRIDAIASGAGLIHANSRVDVLVVRRDSTTGRPRAELVIENVRVLAMNVAGERPPYGHPIEVAMASLEVDPTQAKRLANAAMEGSLQLLLRGSGAPESISRDSVRVVVPAR